MHLEVRAKRFGALSSPTPVIPRGMAAPRPFPLGSAVLRYCWDRVCAVPPPEPLPDVSTATPCRRASGWLTPSCPLLGRPTRALQITGNPLSRWCRPSHTEETGPPRPPPEPPPSVSTAPPRRTTSSRSTSPCPSCSSVFSSVHNMKVHARRVHSGTPIAGEGIACGFCDSSTVFPRSASRAGHYQKCQAYQRAKNGQRTSASSNDSHSPSATPILQPPPAAEPPDGPREALPHTLWDNPSRTIAPFRRKNWPRFYGQSSAYQRILTATYNKKKNSLYSQ
ncbi:hypothetical protein ECC02_012246 [Trypanosoma cruzi]|uniref:C2H2-type domain-containing protein n=1 Tax=Trypanosoma cruzi TaxID=5693 RepID=A0A7J6XKP6_TRYCR|nr:hypothetical protein ECC02_012246 [Trypanosoma cruzi]